MDMLIRSRSGQEVPVPPPRSPEPKPSPREPNPVPPLEQPAPTTPIPRADPPPYASSLRVTLGNGREQLAAGPHVRHPRGG
jgi:hypothetical protein